VTGEDIRVQLDPADEARLLRDVKAFDKELAKALTKRIRTVVQPLGVRIAQEVAPDLPHRGGLAYRIAGVRGTVSTRTGLRSAGVILSFRKPRVLGYIDKGLIPHPVYADVNRPRASWTWRTQSIRPGLVTAAFQRHEAQAKAAVEQAVLDAASTIHAGEAHQ
jgi:hypothetical protein